MRRASERAVAETPPPPDEHLALVRHFVELAKCGERGLQAVESFIRSLGADDPTWERVRAAIDLDELLVNAIERYARKICECTTIEDARALVAYAEDPLFQRVRDLDALFFQEQKSFNESWFAERAEAIEKALGGG